MVLFLVSVAFLFIVTNNIVCLIKKFPEQSTVAKDVCNVASVRNGKQRNIVH